MNKFFKKKLSLIFFIFIPIIFLWHPNWLGFLGIQPYWPLFWLLPWSMINGPINGLIFGLFLGLILDSVTLDNSFSQIPGLIVCGIWFGRIKINTDILVGHFRYGLICALGSFLCGTLYFWQIFFKNFSESTFLFFIPSIQNILAEVFITGLFAPLICSQLFRLFKSFNEMSIRTNFLRK
jgi:cell shape-determining protein MreD